MKKSFVRPGLLSLALVVLLTGISVFASGPTTNAASFDPPQNGKHMKHRKHHNRKRTAVDGYRRRHRHHKHHN